MKVYTKKGDSGTTQLIGGTRVVKSSMRIESYGTVDELNSYLGLIRDQEISTSQTEQLLEIQDRLFTMGSLLAADPKGTKMELPQLKDSDVENLENWIDQMEETLEPMKSFILPGGHTTVSFCHIARCVCRKAERIVVDLNENEKIDPVILTYLNRLSDYMFVLSRKLSSDLKTNEIHWKPRM
ncbi:MAG: cob(I)yrinic acid a,c-diamide adenosyltransferase [Crocinitomicaceae bacterium]|nr:cob(I)yrinic acid a,c-diamide adenosyltransferase [Crocinitomicaceae bacterium]